MADSAYPNDLAYAKSHEWVRVDGDVATVGITAFAVEQLSDLVYTDLPEVGAGVTAGEPFGEIESVKAASDLVAPLGGEVIEVNADLPDHLDWLSEDPYGKGWMVRIRMADGLPDGLLDAGAYAAHTAAEAH